MKVSVVTSTYRMGGLDVLYAGLHAQTCKDFELVVVDVVKPWRKDLFGLDMGYGLMSVPTVAVCPDPTPFPDFAFSKCYNAGIDAASGDVILFCCDYTVLHPEAVERVIRHFEASPDVGWMGPQDFLQAPPLHPDFPQYDGRAGKPYSESPDLGRYVDDVRFGRLDRFGYSVFKHPYHGGDLGPCPVQSQADPKLRMGSGPVGPEFFHCANQAVPAAVAKRVRFNEGLDGAYGQHDIQFARATGLPFVLDRECVAHIVNPRPFFPHLRVTRPDNR